MHKRWRIVVGSSWYIMCEFGGWCGVGGLQGGGPQGKPSEGWFRRPQADGSGEAGAPGGPYAGGLQGVVEANGQRKTPRHSRGGIGGDGMVSGGGEGRRPPARRAGKRAKPASALRSSAGPAARIPGSAGGRITFLQGRRRCGQRSGRY